jgi:biopolymer transport protein TolR
VPKITPPAGVLVVLIIVFLLGARLSQEGIISAPSASDKPRPHITAGAGDVVLEYSADRRITVNKQEVSRAQLGAVLADIYRDRSDRTMWLLGAGTVRYGEIADLIDTAKRAGVERVGVITPEMGKRRWR